MLPVWPRIAILMHKMKCGSPKGDALLIKCQKYTWIDGISFREASLTFAEIFQSLDLPHPDLFVEAQSLFWKACQTQQGFLWFTLVRAKCKQTKDCHQMFFTQMTLADFRGYSGSHSSSLLLSVGTYLTAELPKQITRAPEPWDPVKFPDLFHKV